MSCVDLATLTLHRRHELESRIHIFEEKCDRAINDVKKLKVKAKSFVPYLNCDPSVLKDRFLYVMQKLEEYMYLITDFNLAMAQTAESTSSEPTPVQDVSVLSLQPTLSPFNLMDVLTEAKPSMSHACPNQCPPHKPLRVKIPKDEQRLIVFSSSSSAESVRRKSEKEIQCEMAADMAQLDIEAVKNDTDCIASEPRVTPVSFSSAADNYKECCISAAQTILEVDHEYPATIMNIDGGSFSVITDDLTEVTNFMSDMTDYYIKNKKTVSAAELEQMTYCAYSDDGFYYRAMFLDKPKRDQKILKLYIVDTGEIRTAPVESVQPLHRQFCDRPPYARFCHLAGVDIGDGKYDKGMIQKQDEFLKEYCNMQCTIVVDDNSSESLGVYVLLPSMETTLNDLVVQNNLAVPIDKPLRAIKGVQHDYREPPPGFTTRAPPLDHPGNLRRSIPPPASSEDEWNPGNIDITQCPEYEDPVVAVTGYHNRDEADICKYYKGGPSKTCFKGPKCPKKHILHHPDGWTLDQVSILAKCESVPLPEPGTCVKVLVTAICHFDRVFVQIIKDKNTEEPVPAFGVVLPPMTLEALQRDMNSPATIQAYKKLTMTPAPCEMVAALYHDNCWYRARVRTVTRADQCVEVMYVDYGTITWVKEDQIRALEPRFRALPAQAVQCALAGVLQRGESAQWARAKRALSDMVLDRELDAHIIAREFDEVIVDLITYDDPRDPTRGLSVAEQLAERGLVELQEFAVTLDYDVTQKLIVP